MMKKFVLFLALLLSSPVHAQTIDALGAGAAVTDTDLYPSYQGANPAKRVTAAQVKTYANTSAVRATTTTGEAIANSDQNKLVTFSNAAAVACTIAQAGSGGNFAAGWAVSLKNLGAGTVTCTPTTSTVDGAANFTLTTGQGVDLYSDGANYFTQPGRGGSATTDASLLTSGTLAAARLPAFTGDCTAAVGTGATVCNSAHPGYAANLWYSSPTFYLQAVGNAVVTASRIVCKYGEVPRTVTIGALGARVTTAGTTNFQLALYANSGGRPGALVGNTGNITSASLGLQSAALAANKQVGPGGADGSRDVWWCMNVNDTTTVFMVESGSTMSQAANAGSATASDLITGATAGSFNSISCTGAACAGGSSAFNTWPATLAGSTWTHNTPGTTGNIMPIVVFQAASVP